MSTIHDLAVSTRRRGLEHYGEADFARLCLDFDKQLPEHSLNSLFTLLVEFDNAKTMQLAFCWLDANGYGSRSVEWLGQELARVRQNIE